MTGTFRKRPRPKPHKFIPILSLSRKECEHCDVCNECRDKFAEQAENDSPGHAWRVENGKIVYMEDAIMEHHLGRKLKANEQVIHRNNNPLHNTLSNLELITIPDMEKS